MNLHTVSSLEGYLRKLSSLTTDYPGGLYAYRGQGDDSWPVQCSALRRIKRESPYVSLKYYHIMLLANAKMRKPLWIDSNKDSDLSLLVELQHYGAATILIDFTYDSLLALYFACADRKNCNGAVYCFELNQARHLSKSEEEYDIDQLVDLCKGSVYLVNPHFTNDRIVMQSSVMLMENSGMIADDILSHKIIIDQKSKIQILKDLKSISYVDEITVYPDFVGYAKANGPSCLLDGFPDLKKYSDPKTENKEKYLKRLLVIAPYSCDFWLDMGAIKLAHKDIKFATNCFQNAIQITPQDCEIPLRIYEICMQYDNNDLALRYNDKAISCSQISVENLYKIAANYLDGNCFESAVKTCERIMLVDFSDESNNLLGKSLFGRWGQTKNHEDLNYAIKCFEESIQINPKISEYWFNLGNCYYSLDNYNKALPLFLRAHKLEDKIEYILKIGISFSYLGRHMEADTYFSLMNRKQPNDFLTIYYLGINNCYLGRYGKSRQYLTKARVMDPDDFDVIEALGVLYSKQNKQLEAIQLYKDYIEDHPEDIIAMHNMACFFFESCQFEEAFTWVNRILEEDPNYAEGWSFMGNLYLVKKDYIRAEFYVNKSLSILDNYQAHMVMGHLRYLKGDDDFLKSYITSFLLDEDHFEFFDAVKRELYQLLENTEAKRVFNLIKRTIGDDKYKNLRLKHKSLNIT